jgi:acyl carrier protein
VDREEGLAVVCAVVADSLGLAPQEVTPGSRLITDLSADSLDIIDLVFTLERRFALKLRNGELDALLRGELFTPAAVEDGFLRPEAVERLGRVIPAMAGVAGGGRVTPGQIISLITVESLWLMIERRMTVQQGPG